MPKTIQIATDVWKRLKIRSAEEEVPISQIANRILRNKLIESGERVAGPELDKKFEEAEEDEE